MNEKIPEKPNRFKLILSLLIANGIRLLKIIPNNDPIMSMALPFSRRSSILTSFAFPFITMASFDFVTGFVGPWTAITAITYGLLGILFHFILKNREKVGIKTYLGFGIFGVIFFDFITGVVATPLLFPPMSFMDAFIGQIPFTVTHLLTTCFFILIVTPIIDKQVLLNERLDDSRIWSFASKLVYS